MRTLFFALMWMSVALAVLGGLFATFAPNVMSHRLAAQRTRAFGIAVIIFGVVLALVVMGVAWATGAWQSA